MTFHKGGQYVRLDLDEEDWQRERRDAWVRFAAAIRSMPEDESYTRYDSNDAAIMADYMLAEFDARFGKKEAAK